MFSYFSSNALKSLLKVYSLNFILNYYREGCKIKWLERQMKRLAAIFLSLGEMLLIDNLTTPIL